MVRLRPVRRARHKARERQAGHGAAPAAGEEQSVARVYLAGPEVFRPDAVAEGERLRRLCAVHGLEGLYPLDGGAAEDTAHDIRVRCIAGIVRADAVVANITPFRGAHMDPGTAWEIGFAEARGVPVFLWSSDPRALAERIPGTPGHDGLRDADGHLLEDFGQPENLMIAPPGVTVWPSPEAAVAAAAEMLALRQSLRLGLLPKVLIALAASIVAGYVARLVLRW